MEVSYINSSLLLISQGLSQRTNLSREVSYATTYETCRHIPAVLVWYISLMVTNMLLSIPANVLVLWLIRNSKGDSSTSDIFIVHLALLDVFFCLTIPLQLAILVYPLPLVTWNVLFVVFGIKDSSPIFLCCVCLDRYMAVLHPIMFSQLKDRHHRGILVTAVWLITLGYAIAKGSDMNLSATSYNVYTAMILAVFAFLLFCNVAVLVALRKSTPGRDERHPVKKRAFKMLLIVLAIIIFNYFPVVALFPFRQYFAPDVFFCYVHHIAFGLLNFSSTFQPLLYLSKDWLPRACSLCCPKRQSELQPES